MLPVFCEGKCFVCCLLGNSNKVAVLLRKDAGNELDKVVRSWPVDTIYGRASSFRVQEILTKFYDKISCLNYLDKSHCNLGLLVNVAYSSKVKSLEKNHSTLGLSESITLIQEEKECLRITKAIFH